MCGRYVLASGGDAVQAAFGLADRPMLTPRYNIAPSQPLPAILRRAADTAPELVTLQWGLVPGWAHGETAARRPINARAETVSERPMFRQAFRRRRCLVPADGWYEWSVTAQGKQPWYLQAGDGALLAFAGLWESATGPDGEPLRTCAILTTDASPDLAHVHARMPVVLQRPAERALWLDPTIGDRDSLAPLLGPVRAGAIAARRVGRRVNDPRHDDPRCLAMDEAPPDPS